MAGLVRERQWDSSVPNLFDGEQWTSREPGDLPALKGAWLLMDIHDSDFTEVTYRPTGPGSGIAYLGFTPRVYFENESASAPTDPAREAEGLAFWWGQLHGDVSGAQVEAKAAELTAYLAGDVEPPEDEDEDKDEPDRDDADVFVEVKTARFLDVLDLPAVEDLPR